jgi:hypothetical protein
LIDCARTAELLPWLLNDTLSEAERQEVVRHLAECTSCAEELEETGLAWLVHGQHVPTSQLVDWALALPLDGEQARRVERHLEDCAACRQELALLRQVREIEVGAAKPTTAARGGAWRWVALAASLGAVVAASGWLWSARGSRQTADRLAELRRSHQELSSSVERERATTREEGARLRQRIAALTAPVINVAVAELAPEVAVRGGAGEATKVVVPAAAAQLILVLLAEDLTAFPALRLELLDPAGKVLWQVEGLVRRESGDYTVLVPLEAVPSGRLDLRVMGRRGERWVRVEEYRLEVERR